MKNSTIEWTHHTFNPWIGCTHDFLPYHYGPLSFSLYQEIGKLQDQGFVKQSDDFRLNT